MTESELETLVANFVEGFRRAFHDVGKKGAADQSTVIAYLSRGLIEGDKLKREYATKDVYESHTTALRQQLEGHIQKFAETGRPDQGKVMKKLHASHAAMGLVAQLKNELADIGLQQMTKREVEREQKAERAEAEAAAKRAITGQRAFAFMNAPEFVPVRNVVIRYVNPDTGKLEEISYAADSLAKHREYSIKQHERNARQHSDKAEDERVRAREEKAANELLSPLVKIYGDEPPMILWDKKLRDESKRPKASGDD